MNNFFRDAVRAVWEEARGAVSPAATAPAGDADEATFWALRNAQDRFAEVVCAMASSEEDLRGRVGRAMLELVRYMTNRPLPDVAIAHEWRELLMAFGTKPPDEAIATMTDADVRGIARAICAIDLKLRRSR